MEEASGPRDRGEALLPDQKSSRLKPTDRTVRLKL